MTLGKFESPSVDDWGGLLRPNKFSAAKPPEADSSGTAKAYNSVLFMPPVYSIQRRARGTCAPCGVHVALVARTTCGTSAQTGAV